MDHEFSDVDVSFEDYLTNWSGERTGLELGTDASSCFFNKSDIIAMGEALGIVLVETL